MKAWITRQWRTRRGFAAALALAVALSVGGYEVAKPAAARAAGAAPAAPAAAPLDDNSVSALLALDHAMETVAARVTPAVVNVTVASHGKGQQIQMQGDDGEGQGQGQGDDNGI